MIVGIIVAAIIGAVVWALGSLFDASAGNINARRAGFIVFIVITVLVILNHYGGVLGLN